MRFTWSEHEQKLLCYAAKVNCKFHIVSFWNWCLLSSWVEQLWNWRSVQGTPALSWEIIKTRKKNASLYSIRSSGTLRCFSGLGSWVQPFMCYLWLHSLSCSLHLFVLSGYSSLWRDLFFFPPVWIGWDPLQGLTDHSEVWSKPGMRRACEVPPMVYGLQIITFFYLLPR